METAEREVTQRTAKWKRIVAAILGTIGLFSGLIACVYLIAAVEDFTNQAVPFSLAAAGEFFLFSIVLAAIGLSIRFLRFALRGTVSRKGNLIGHFLIGVACFFPGFIFSLIPAELLWPNHEDTFDGAMVFSICIGVVAAVVGCIIQLRKRKERYALQ